MKTLYTNVQGLGIGLLVSSSICFASANIERGNILDTNGQILATNQKGFSVKLAKGLSEDKLNKAIKSIEKVFKDIDKKQIYHIYETLDIKEYDTKYIKVVNYISSGDMAKNSKISFLTKDVKLSPKIKRVYPYSFLVSHTIGAVQKENGQYIGKSGIEKKYNDLLENSMDIALTIDIRLQESISNELHRIDGAVVVMDIDNGAILATNSYPTYNLNYYSSKAGRWLLNYEAKEDPYEPFKNRITSQLCHIDTNTTLELKENNMSNKVHCYNKNMELSYQYKTSDKFINAVGYKYFLVSPLEITAQTAMLASGIYTEPRIIKDISTDRKFFSYSNNLNKVQKSTLVSLRDNMKEEGKHIRLKNTNVGVAMKSINMTIKRKREKFKKYKKYFSLPTFILTSYAPANEPKYVVTILREHDQDNSNINRTLVNIYNKMIELKYLENR